jgi:serine/threonine-protein kinase
MSGTFCQRCSSPVAAEVCGCGEARPPEGWPSDPLLNTWIEDRYRVVRRLGYGGTSQVYLARRRHSPGYVALKMVLPNLKHQKWQVRLEREAQVLQRLRSPYAVRLEWLGRLHDRRLYLAMEYLEGRTLADLLDEYGSLPVDRAVLMMVQTAHALADAHAAGFVHRDLKPANLMCLDGAPLDRVKLMDFGIAETVGLLERPGVADTVLGTPRYMAPEQVSRPDRADPRSDIFSLGMVLYELVSGRFPYPWEATSQMLSRRATEPPVPLERLLPPPGLPANLYAVIGRMIEPRLERRYQRMNDVVDGLLAVREALRAFGGGSERWVGSSSGV